MRVYVAGSIEAFMEVREAQALLLEAGHVITHDWTEGLVLGASDLELTGQKSADAALADVLGVMMADVVVALWHPRVFGTLIELGVAIARRTRVLLTVHPKYPGGWRESVFWSLPEVQYIMWEGLGSL